MSDADNPADRIPDNPDTDDTTDADDSDDSEQHAPEWVDEVGFDQETTYARHLTNGYWWLLSAVGDQYAVSVAERSDDGEVDVKFGQTVEFASSSDKEWWESEQKLRSHKNRLAEDDDIEVTEQTLKTELLDAQSELTQQAGDDLWNGSDATGFGDVDLPDPISAEDLYERTAYVQRERYGDEEKYHVFLRRDDGEKQKITLEGEAWRKEDGQSTQPAVKHKAEAVLNERVEVSWSDWTKLKAHWREDAETTVDDAETEWDVYADQVARELFYGARVTREREALMNESGEVVGWYDDAEPEHDGRAAPEDAPAGSVDEAVVWVRAQDVEEVCRDDLGIDMAGKEKRSQMRELTQALRRKGYTTRGPWQTRVAGFNVRLIPFRMSEIGVDEADVAGDDDDEIAPGGAPVGGDDDDDDDDDGGDDASADGDDADASAGESESAVNAGDDTGDGGGEGDNADGEDAGDSDDAAGADADELRLVEKCVRKHSDAWDDPVPESKVTSEVVSRAGVNSSPTVNPDAVPAMLEVLADDDDSMVAHAGTTRDGDEEQYAWDGGDGR